MFSEARFFSTVTERKTLFRFFYRDRGRVLFIKMLVPNIMLRLTRDERGQAENSNEIRNSHKRVRDVGDIPNEALQTDRTQEADHQKDDLIRTNRMLTEEIRDTTIAVVRPANHR